MPTTPLDRQLVSVKPVTVPTIGRGAELQVNVTAPVDGNDLPVIVFSHGNAWSMDGYEPLVERWAAAGFVVVQPTHLDTRRNPIGFDDPRFASIAAVGHSWGAQTIGALLGARVLDATGPRARTSPTPRSRQAHSFPRPAPATA